MNKFQTVPKAELRAAAADLIRTYLSKGGMISKQVPHFKDVKSFRTGSQFDTKKANKIARKG